jgi:peptide/nickel transport system permease protein
MNENQLGPSWRTAALAVARPANRLVIEAGQTSRSFIKRRPLGGISGIVILVMILVALFAPLVARYDPMVQHGGRILEWPSWEFWMGTDHLGRDIYSRVVHGTRVSITVGFVAVAIGTTGGSLIGLVSAFQGGKFDLYVQRFVDAWIAFPGLVLILVLVSMLGPSLLNVSVAIGIGTIPSTSRIVRSAVLTIKQNEYVLAAHAVGASSIRIGVRHILPNVTAPIIIISTVSLGGAILAESSLSFLGLGVPPPAPTWGGMLSREGREYMLIQPLLGIWPGLAITTVVMAFNLFGDALRDVWDPRLRGAH